MKKSDMLECLINYYTDGNKSKFGRKLGLTPQTISAWLNRNTFDMELIYAKCEGVSADWLLSSGEGEMLRSGNEITIHPTRSEKDLIQLCKLLVKNYQQRDKIFSQLDSMVKKME